jgi:hypothetical protein
MLAQKDFFSRGYQVLAIDIKYLRAHPSHAFKVVRENTKHHISDF